MTVVAERELVDPERTDAVWTRSARVRTALVAFVALLPFVIDPSGWYVTVALRWLVLMVFVAVVAINLLTARRDRVTRSIAGARWWLALAVVAVASASMSSAPMTSLFGTMDRRFGAFTWLAHGALFLSAATVVRTRCHVASIARGLVLGTIGVGFFTAAQQLGWDFPANAVNRVRPGGPFGNADLLGVYCVLGVLVAVGMALDAAGSTRWRVAAMVAAAAGLVTVAASGSRGAWLGLVVGGIGLAARRGAARDPARRGGARGIARRVVVVGLVGIGLVAVLGATGTLGRLSALADGTARGRVDTWTRAAEAAIDRPVLGWGPEGFSEGFGPRIDDTYERSYTRRLMPDRAHAAPLDVAVTLGLVGLAVWMGLLWAVARAASRTIREEGSTLVAAVGFALVGLLVAELTLFPTFDVDAIAWVLAGALVGLGAASAPAIRSNRRRPVTVGVAVLGIVGVVAAAMGLISDRSARAAADALQNGSPAAAVISARRAVLVGPAQTLPALALADAAIATADEATIRMTIDDVRSVRGRSFDDGRLTLALGRLTLACADCDRDGVTSDVAELLRRDPSRTDAWSMAAALALDRGDVDGAVAASRRAVGLAPGEDRRWRDLADAWCRGGQVDEAREAALGALRIDPGDEQNLQALGRIDAASCPSLYTSPP